MTGAVPPRPASYPGGRVLVLLVVAVSAGLTLLAGAPPAAVAAATGGRVAGWGYDDEGQVDVPRSLHGKTVTAVSAGGFHSLALTSDGRVTGWGRNSSGQAEVPASLARQTVTAIAAGMDHSLALTSTGQVTAWGGNASGERDVPADLADQEVTAIAGGVFHSLALTATGQVVAWGDDYFGQTTVPASLAKQRVTAIAAGGFHNLALTSDGRVTAWGANGYGETDIPASLANVKVTAIAAGYSHSLALTSNGQVVAWGSNVSGQAVVPADLAGRTVTAIAAGGDHNLALTSDGRLTDWGSDDYNESTVPRSVRGQRVTAIAAGYAHNLVVVADTAPTVASSPVSVTVRLGEAASFTASAAGGPPPAVRWQRADPGEKFVDIRRAISPTYSTGAVTTSDDGARFRAVFTNPSGTAVTAPATLTVDRTQICGTVKPQLRFSVDGETPDNESSSVRTPTFTTTKGGELLVAFIAVNGPSEPAQTVTSVTGGDLTWKRIKRDNTSFGTSEIWQAYAPTKLAPTRVTAGYAAAGYTATMTVAGFTGAGRGVGTASHQSGAETTPRVSVTPKSSKSLVWAVGRASGSRYNPQPVAGQRIVHDHTFTPLETGYWIQRATDGTTAGMPVQIRDTNSAEDWGYAAVEIRGTCR